MAVANLIGRGFFTRRVLCVCLLSCVLLAGCTTKVATAIIRVRTNGMDAEKYEVFKETQRAMIKSPYVLRSALISPEITALFKEIEKPIDWLQDNLMVSYPGDSELMTVRLRSKKPDEARKVVNAVVNRFIEETSKLEKGEIHSELVALEGSYRKTAEELQKATDALEALACELGSPLSQHVAFDAQIELEKVKALARRVAELEADLALANASAAVQSSDATTKRQRIMEEAFQEQSQRLSAARSVLHEKTNFSSQLELKKTEVLILEDRLKSIAADVHKAKSRLLEEPLVRLIQAADVKDE